MSLDGLVVQVGQLLGDARGLYGPAPQSGGWSSTVGLRSGRDGVAQAGGVAPGWAGAASSTHAAATGGRVLALDHVIGADGQTASGFGGAAETSQSGRSGMNGVVEDTRRGVAAIAPSTDTPAGKRQLVDHLQSQLDRAKALLTVSEQRNVMLAQMIRGGAAGYRGGPPMAGAMPPMMGGGMGGMSPTSLGGIPNLGAMVPNLSSLTRLGANPRSGGGLDTFPASAHSRGAVGGGPLAQMAVKAALSKQGAPYIWGAKGPNTFDCSGLTGWAWREAGVTLGPDTYSQIKQGIPVAPGDVEPGDLIFPRDSWDSEGPGHVQLAISKDSVVHAPQSNDVVRIAPMPKDFVARRPVVD
jgi:cell wall-associated NlpC family hydrolase